MSNNKAITVTAWPKNLAHSVEELRRKTNQDHDTYLGHNPLLARGDLKKMKQWPALVLLAALIGCGGGSSQSNSNNPPPPPLPPSQDSLTVNVTGDGSVTSTPAGIACPGTCTAKFDSGTKLSLSATAASGYVFSGYAGACAQSTCQLTLTSNQTLGASFTPAPPPPPPPQPPPPPSTHTLQSSINHIIFMMQENRSFDHYFSHLPEYWSKYGFPQATNGTSLDVESNSDSNLDPNGVAVHPFKLNTQCLENPSPSWNESHADFNHNDPDGTKGGTFAGDGFVQTAAHEGTYYDTVGHRVMGYYDETVLNYYYFMASTFGTADHFYSPNLSRSQPNRAYSYAATSMGHAYQLISGSAQLSSLTILQVLDQNNISWKIYVHPTPSGCATVQCLDSQSYLNQFTYNRHVLSVEPNNIAPISQYFTDLKNGTLPQVVFIEPASEMGWDEHPTGDHNDPTVSPIHIQPGAKYVSSLINALMGSSSWKDSVFILSWDEAGGFYDHEQPMSVPNPDGINPIDLGILGGRDICQDSNLYLITTPICTFRVSGYRLPMIVVSPFTKNFVSHTPMDYTAVLRLIETRFNLSPLNHRDAAMPDMTEFFDFAGAPWATPPSNVPVQRTDAPCYLSSLP
jgi:phospholipase C